MSTATTNSTGLTDLDPATVRYWTVAGTDRREIWLARSADGIWEYERHNDTGTSWTVTHLPTKRVWPGEASLLTARAGTYWGWILIRLDARSAPAARTYCTSRGQWTGAPCSEPAAAGHTTCTRHLPGEDAA